MTLPNGIDLEQYKTQSKDLLKQARSAEADAHIRIRRHHPEQEALLASGRLQLADAQLVIARENGFASWTRFREYLHFHRAVHA